jgi:hypothetical protein
MIAVLALAPTTASILGVLQAIADALVAINERWIRAQLQAGQRPPSSLATARPPWAPRRIAYRASHGAAVGTTRTYQDGPTAMHSGVATCMDIAAYDAAALSVLAGTPTTVVVLPMGTSGTPLQCHAWMRTQLGELVDPLASFSKEGA